MPQLQLDNRHWYTEDDIIGLINIQLSNGNEERVHTSAQTQLENESLLTSNLVEALSKIMVNDFKAAILPIQLHQNHWSVMVIGKDNDDDITAIYNDPLGNRIENEPNAAKAMESLTELRPDITFVDLATKQQDNDYDCGPFTVDNALYITDKFLEGLIDKAITRDNFGLFRGGASGQLLRKNHQDLLNKYNLETQLDLQAN